MQNSWIKLLKLPSQVELPLAVMFGRKISAQKTLKEGEQESHVLA